MYTSDYLKLPHLCFDKTTDSIQEYDYYTLDAFLSEKSPFFQRNISPPTPRVCAGGVCSSDRAA